MTKNELARLFHAARSMALFASEIRDELDEAASCALWEDDYKKSSNAVRERLTGLVDAFIASYERALEATRNDE